MEVQEQGACDEVFAFKQLLQRMLLVDQDEDMGHSLPAVRNDKRLQLMGISKSDTAGCSAYDLDDERPASVLPLEILSQQLQQEQHIFYPNYDCQEEPDVEVSLNRTDTEKLMDDDQYLVEEDKPRQEGYFSRSYVNTTSTKLSRRSGTFESDLQTRMKHVSLKNEQKEEKIRQSLRIEKEPDVIPMPRINRRSKCIPRNVSHLMAWNHEKECKLARMRDAETAKQNAFCVGKPSISKRSVSIFSKRQDDVALCKVEDRLHLLGLIYQYQQEERTRAEKRQASSSIQPRLAPHSANAQRRMRFSVHERLFQLSKRNLATTNNSSKEHYYPKNNAARRKRERNANSKSFEDTAQRLHALDRHYKQKQQLLSEERKRYFDNLRLTPKMSARSRKLAAKRKKSSAPKSPIRCGCCGGKEDQEGKCGCTIESRVNQKNAAEIYERQLKWKNANEARHCQQKQLQEALSMAECTFRNPFYQTAWNTLDGQVSRSNEKGTAQTSAAFFKRCMVWAEKRDQQVAQEKIAFQEQQLEECTFKPRVIARTPKYLTAKRKDSNQQDKVAPLTSRLVSLAPYLDCPTTSSPERRHLSTEELITQLYSALDLQVLAGELSSEHNSIGSNADGTHGLPKYTFTDLGEFAGR